MDTQSYILWVSRDQIFLKTICQTLLDAGFAVLTAGSKIDALDLLSGHTVELIICDSELADSSGFDFLGYLKNHPSLKNIPFIFLVSSQSIIDTLEEEVSKIVKAFDMGASDFIVHTPEEDVSKVLVKHVDKILTSNVRIKTTPALPQKTSGESFYLQEGCSPAAPERRDGVRTVPEQMVNIGVSRDADLWVPGQIKNISERGLMIGTSMLGKLGMLLYIKVPLPGEKSIIVKGHIKHIEIIPNQHSIAMGMEIEESIEWIEIYNYVVKLMGIVKKPEGKKLSETEKKTGERIIGAGSPMQKEDNKKQHSDPLLYHSEEFRSKKELEIKFYHSLVGKQLGNYKAVSFIGAGNMAGVFKGWDVVLERDVALKIISYNLSTIASYRDMFIKEARLVARLTHPNIAQIYHIDQMDDILFFAMELINGGTLADIIRNRNSFDETSSLENFITVCRTLDFVGKQNIVHRDIKPANIMIDDQGLLKVVDFGVAIVNDRINDKRTPQGFGSPLYVSPECIMGQPLDCRSDIYSLGATFYHVFAGVPPFDGDSVDTVLQKHMNEALIPLKKKRPRLSIHLSYIIGKMMAKKSGDRYQNYQAIINDLTVLMNRKRPVESSPSATEEFYPSDSAPF